MIAGYKGLLVRHMHFNGALAKPDTSSTVAAAGTKSSTTSREEEPVNNCPMVHIEPTYLRRGRAIGPAKKTTTTTKK